AFGHVDAAIVRAVDAVQREHGVGGDILQIGARYGESTVLLGYLRQDGECLVVCDVFDGDGWYGDLRREFESTYLTFHDELPTVLQCSSTQLGSAGLRRTFRLVHVAGSTELSIVSSDIAKAKELLVEGGVAVGRRGRDAGVQRWRRRRRGAARRAAARGGGVEASGEGAGTRAARALRPPGTSCRGVVPPRWGSPIRLTCGTRRGLWACRAR